MKEKNKIKCDKKMSAMTSKFNELLRPKQAWLAAFVLVAVIELVFIAMHIFPSVVLVATWVLMPLLVLALVFCWLGDMLGNPLAIGIGQIGVVGSAAAFAVAGIFLFVLFIRRGAFDALRGSAGTRRGWLVGAAAVYLAAAIICVLFVWSGFVIEFRIFVLIYLLLFAALAIFALSAGIVTAIGAAMFFGTEILAALEVAGRLHGAATAYRLTFNTLYLLGILLIAVGIVLLGPHPHTNSRTDHALKQRFIESTRKNHR